MAVNHEQVKFPRMPRGRNQMPYYGQCPDTDMSHMQRAHCFPDAYGGKMDGPCGMGVSEFKSPMMNPDPPPQPAKKKRRTSNAMAASAQSNSQPVMADLLPPPLSGFGDTIVASNPFDDSPPAPSMSHMNSMNHVNKHMGVGPCMSPAGNPMMGSMSPCQIVGSPLPCGPPVGSPINCGPPIGSCSPLSNAGGNANCGPIGSPVTSCNSRQISRSPLICTPMSNNPVMGNSGMNPMNRSPSSVGSPLGSVMASNVRGNSPLDCGLSMSSVGSQKGSPMSVLSSHNMSSLNCGSPMGSPSNVPMNSCNNGNMIGSPITSPLSVPCSMGSGGDHNSMNMGNMMNRSPMNAGPNSVMCHTSMRGPSPISPMMNCGPSMGMGPKSDMNMNELALRESHMPLKPPNGPGNCGMPPNMSGPRPSDMGCGPMNNMHCNTMMNNQCPPGINNMSCIGGNMNRGQCGPGPGPGPGPGSGSMVMNNMYDGMNPQCRPSMNRSQFSRGLMGVGFNGGMNSMGGPVGPGSNMNACGPQDLPIGCGPNGGNGVNQGGGGGMHCLDIPMNNSACMGQNMNQCSGSMFNSQFNPFEMNNSRCSPSLPFNTNDMNPMSSNSNINSINSMANSIAQNNNFYRSNMSCMSNMVAMSSAADSLNIGPSIMSTGLMKNDCSTVDSDLNNLACSMPSNDPTDDLSLLEDNLLRDTTTNSLTTTTASSSTNLKINEDQKSMKDLLLTDTGIGGEIKDEEMEKTTKSIDSDSKLNEDKESKSDTEVMKDSLVTSPTNTTVTSAGTPSSVTTTLANISNTTSDRPSSVNSAPATTSSSINDARSIGSDIGDSMMIKNEVDGANLTSNASEKTETTSEDGSTEERKNADEKKLLESEFGSQDDEKIKEGKSGSVDVTVKMEDTGSDQRKDNSSTASVVPVKMENDEFLDLNLKKNDNINNGRASNGSGFNNGNVLPNTSTHNNFSVTTSADMSMMSNTSACNINDNAMCGSPMLPTMNRLPMTPPHSLNQSMNFPNKTNINMYPGRGFPGNKSKFCNSQTSNSVAVHTCGQCHKEIKEADEFVMCESGCNVWYHRICVGMTEDAYRYISQELFAEWVCDKCIQTRQVPLVKMKS